MLSPPPRGGNAAAAAAAAEQLARQVPTSSSRMMEQSLFDLFFNLTLSLHFTWFFDKLMPEKG
jgi:hypothetical protein